MREVYESDFSFGGQRVRQIHRTRTEAEVAERQGKALDLARRIEEWTPGKKSILYLKAWRDGDARILENMLLAMEVVRQPTDRDVLLEIIWCAKGNGTDAAVSIKCIGLRIGRSQETVKAARTRLERKRFISYNEGGGGHTCIYTVHLDRLASQRPIPIAQDNGSLGELLDAGASACGITVGAYVQSILEKHVQKNLYASTPPSCAREIQKSGAKRGIRPIVN